jgi:hypothetical protein
MTVRYNLPAAGVVGIGLYDLSGKMVKQLYSGAEQAGRITQSLNVPEIANTHGTYVVQLKTAMGSYSDKVVLVK